MRCKMVLPLSAESSVQLDSWIDNFISMFANGERGNGNVRLDAGIDRVHHGIDGVVFDDDAKAGKGDEPISEGKAGIQQFRSAVC